MFNYYIYKVTNPQTGEFYIGSRKTKLEPEKDRYKGSMVTWKVDKSILIKEIINCNFDSYSSLIEEESRLIRLNLENPLNRNYHIPDGEWLRIESHTEETKAKMRKPKSSTENMKKPKGPMSEDHKQKISNSSKLKGKTYEEVYGEEKAIELKKLRSENMKKPKSSTENMKKPKGPMSEEHKQKIRLAMLGKKKSEEHKDKIRQSMKKSVTQNE